MAKRLSPEIPRTEGTEPRRTPSIRVSEPVVTPPVKEHQDLGRTREKIASTLPVTIEKTEVSTQPPSLTDQETGELVADSLHGEDLDDPTELEKIVGE